MSNKIFLLIILLFLLVGCSQENKNAVKQGDTIKIGVVLSLTGSASVWGWNAKRGLDLALEEINSKGGVRGKKIELVYEDSQTDPKKAVAALNKLISLYKVPAVIGDIASSCVLAMAPIAERNKVVLISPGASSPDITYAGDFIFRNWQSDALEGKVDALFAFYELKWRKSVIIYIKNAYGFGLANVFKKAFEKLGGKVVYVDSFQQDTVNFESLLHKIARMDFDGVYLIGYPKEMGRFLKQASEFKIRFSVLSTQAFDDKIVIDIAGDAAEGVIFSIPKPPNSSDPIVASFRKKYIERYKKDPGVCSDTGYDALMILAWAMNKVGFDSVKIKDQLYKLKNFKGAAGITTFDKNGDVLKPFIFKEVQNSKFVNYNFKNVTEEFLNDAIGL